MRSKFKISQVSALKPKHYFILLGKLTSGKISVGMNLLYEDIDGNFSLLPIVNIGFTLFRKGSRTTELVTLCIPYENEAMLAEFRKLKLRNKSFYISKPAIRTIYTSKVRGSAAELFARENRPAYGADRVPNPAPKFASRRTTSLKNAGVKRRKSVAKKAARKKK
jgi:hypothetical protein